MTGKMFTMAALGALAAATPAAAQWNGGSVDTQSLRAEIDDGVARGDISSRDADSLRSQLRGLINLQRQYEQDGFARNERDDLQQRAQGLRNEIAQSEGEAAGDGRYDQGYATNGRSYGGYGNGSTQYDRSAGTYGGYGTYNGNSQGNYGNAYGNGRYGTYNQNNY